ncbi:MAG: MarR family transcriptional regulator [Lysobacterales bacterium]|nr:MAG: MarR family transcriptional regulator [Xanthomonadales bacterium]
MPHSDPDSRSHSASLIELESFLPYRLSVLSNVVSDAIALAYRNRYGLSIPEWRVVAVLARHPGISAAEVGALTRMDAVTVSRAVSRLLRAGRVRRRVSREDRRRSVLRLSAAGGAVYRAVAPLALRFEAELLDGLDATERGRLDVLLRTLFDKARKLAARGAATGPAKAATGRHRTARRRPAR